MFPDLDKNGNSFQTLDADQRGNNRLSHSLAVQKNGGGFSEKVNNITNIKNVVQVDYIEADYEEKDAYGFKKRMPAGYNGSKANPKKKNGGGNGNGNGNGNDGGDGQSGNGNGNPNGLAGGIVGGGNGSGVGGKGGKGGAGKGGGPQGGDGQNLPGGVKPGGQLTDDQIRQIMLEDPEASKFLDGLMPGDDQRFESVVIAQVREKKEVVKTVKIKK